MLAGLQSENRGRPEFPHLEVIWQGAEFKRFLLQLLSEVPCHAGLAEGGRGRPFGVPGASLRGKPYLSRWVFLRVNSVTWKS